MLFVQRQADAGNATASAVVASLATAWEQYPLAKAAVDDPTGDHDLGELDRLVAEARERIETLERHRDELPGSLASAAVRLRDLDALVTQGSEAYARARDRIGSPQGLLEPLDLDAEGDRGLRPWLARLQQQVESGASEASFNGLVAWHKAADEWFANAKRVVDANAAPVAHRNELRGLLDAFRAKAGARGLDEDPDLDRLYAAAKDALYTAPCDLPAAESMVREYVKAVNAGQEGRPA